jgi:hypothetical protein
LRLSIANLTAQTNDTINELTSLLATARESDLTGSLFGASARLAIEWWSANLLQACLSIISKSLPSGQCAYHTSGISEQTICENLCLL